MRSFLKEINVNLQMPELQTAMTAMPANSNKVVAIIDSGIRLDHSDFGASRFTGNACFSTSVGTKLNTNEALPSLCSGAVGSPCSAADTTYSATLASCGHGSHVAGIAGANNNVFVTPGMAPGAKIMAIQSKSLVRTGIPADPYDDTHNSIDTVRSLDHIHRFNVLNSVNKVVAVNMSFGYPSKDFFDPLNACLDTNDGITEAIARLHSQGIAVVASAGNKDDTTAGIAFPACLGTVISVAATSKNFAQVDYSEYILTDNNMVTKLPTIAAPGGDDGVEGQNPNPIVCQANSLSTTPVCSTKFQDTAQRELRSGTSMSAPVIAGLIARFTDRFPALNGLQAANLLVGSGVPFTVTFPNQSTVTMPRVTPLASFSQATLPQAVMASTATCGQINLNWTAPSVMLPTEYRVRLASTAAGLAAAVQTPTGQGATSFPILATQTQFYQVIAKDGTGDGVWSLPASAVPLPCGPAAVANFRIADRETLPSPAIGCFFGLRWNASAEPLTQYKVQEICSGGAPSQIVLVDAARTYLRTQPGMATPCDVVQNLPNT